MVKEGMTTAAETPPPRPEQRRLRAVVWHRALMCNLNHSLCDGESNFTLLTFMFCIVAMRRKRPAGIIPR